MPNEKWKVEPGKTSSAHAYVVNDRGVLLGPVAKDVAAQIVADHNAVGEMRGALESSQILHQFHLCPFKVDLGKDDCACNYHAAVIEVRRVLATAHTR